MIANIIEAQIFHELMHDLKDNLGTHKVTFIINRLTILFTTFVLIYCYYQIRYTGEA